MARDISDEKQKELDLLRFSNIAHHTVNPLEITDAQGRIIYVNPAFEKASGYSKEELIGKNPNIFGSGKQPKSFWKNMWATITSGRVWVGEVENRRRNGDPFFTHLLISPIIDGDGSVVGFFGVHRDITNQKHLEQQLIHAQKMESIGMLAAGLAHEVGNPLTSISSLVQVIQRETKDEFTQDKLELIKSQITRISRTIRGLVDFSRRSSYEVQSTDINKSLHEAVEVVRVGKKAKEVAFHVEFDDTIPKLPLVPDQIQQVFINILINAIDAIHDSMMSRKGKSTGGKISVRSGLTDENVVITLEDNGNGIPEDFIHKIFEPFFTTKKVGEGTGLGLWVSYGIIKSFQGSIKVKSVDAEGTTFTITLPLHSELL
jgi:PAS domain S-box-containing protein